MATRRLWSAGGTGAPAAIAWRRVGRRSPVRSAWRTRFDPDNRRCNGDLRRVGRHRLRNPLRVRGRWTGDVHVRENRRQTVGQGERNERRETHDDTHPLAPAADLTDQRRLRPDHAVGVVDPLGHTGGAGGEGEIALVVRGSGLCLNHLAVDPAPGQPAAAAKPPRAGGNGDAHRSKGPRSQPAEEVKGRQGEEHTRLHGLDTGEQPRQAHPRIEKGGDGPQPEQCVKDGITVDRWPQHVEDAVAGPDPLSGKPAGVAVGEGVKLAEGDGAPRGRSTPPAVRLDQRRPSGLGPATVPEQCREAGILDGGEWNASDGHAAAGPVRGDRPSASARTIATINALMKAAKKHQTEAAASG